jgi:hypothetical protein
MRRNLLFACILFSAFNVFSQAFLASYGFGAVTSTSGVNDPTPPPTITGLTCGAFSANGVGTNPSAGARFSFDTWGTGATTGIDTYSTMTGSLSVNKFYSVTFTPQTNYCITFTSMQYDVRRSGTGVRNWALRSNDDGYTANITCSVAPTQTNCSIVGSNIMFWNFDATSTTTDQKGCSFLFSGSGFTNIVVPRTLHFYAWNAEGNTGTFSIDSVRINGSATICSGIGEITHDLNAGFKFYPNPTNDGILYLEPKTNNAIKIEVLNILGSVVARENKTVSANEKVVLDLNTLPGGTYFVRITEGNKVSTEKFFISK